MRKSFILIFFYSFHFPATGQGNEERIYLHTDKQCYIAGETIWLKAYSMLQFAPHDEISNLYLDLADTKGNILTEKKMPVFFDIAEGNIDISLSAAQGIYLLRAYTKTGLKTNKAITKTIYIFNPTSSKLNVEPPQNSYNSHFFISNNQLTAGLTNTVYYKATGIYNSPVHITGSIVDENKQQVLTFKDKYEGTGKLEWEPVIGKTYTARVVFPNGVIKMYSLPPVLPGGLTISIANKELYISATIRQKGNYEKQKLILLGIMGTNQAFRHEFVMPENEYNVKIPVSDLPEGVLHIVVLHNTDQLGESKTFISKPDSFKIELEEKKDSLALVFPLNISGTFSIAITDYDKEITPVHNNMFDELLINQEDSGGIILAHTNEASGKEITELIVNTISSKKIVIENLEQNNRPLLSDSAFLTIQGKIVDVKTKKPLAKGELIMFFKAKDSSSTIVNPVISKDGNFTISNLVFFDTAVFSYEWKGKQTAELLIDSNSYERANAAFPISFVADTSVFTISDNIQKARDIYNLLNDTFSSGKLLQGVTVTTRTKSSKEQVNKKYATGLFSASGMSRILDLINEPPGYIDMNIFDYIQGKFGDLLVTRTMMGQYSLTSTRAMSMTGGSAEIKLYLDQTEASQDMISGTRLRDVAMIKYFPPGNAQLPGIGAAGVLVVYTKKTEDNVAVTSSFFTHSFKVPGYSPVKEFSETIQNMNAPGSITTLYWDPRIIIDAVNNKYIFKVGQTTSPKRLHVVVEGFTFEGNILCLDTIIEKE